MTERVEIGPCTLILGDCRDVLPTLASIDAVVTDPPYGLSFMGKGWDYDVPDVALWQLAIQAMKPGAHLLSFFGTRTYHRGVVAVEDAGFEIRDQIGWLYGSGFPKSHNLDGEWAGWGTALKPAWEPIVLARKPLVGTVAANVQEHGTGALNIDECRIATGDKLGGGAETGTTAEQKGNDGWTRPWMDDPEAREAHAARVRANVEKAEAIGRWPANVVHDGSEEVLEAFAAFGEKASGKPGVRRQPHSGGDRIGQLRHAPVNGEIEGGFGDSGSAARFFYCAKASREERDAGCDGLPVGELRWSAGTQSPGTFQSENTNRTVRNHHPTVKPVELMKWLVKLVTREDGLVLDSFGGSGTTAVACVKTARRCVLIEQEPAYFAIAVQRVKAAWAGESSPLFGDAS